MNDHLNGSVNLSEDGRYGDATADAVEKFQRQQGLTTDGICGSRTWGAMADYMRPSYNVTANVYYYATTSTGGSGNQRLIVKLTDSRWYVWPSNNLIV